MFSKKQTELRYGLTELTLQLEVIDRSHDEMGDIAVKVFELSQGLSQKWLTADYATKRRTMEIGFLKCRLDDAILVPTIRKPFDVLAEGLSVSSSRADWI
jgi:site-specific DNA recombinase